MTCLIQRLANIVKDPYKRSQFIKPVACLQRSKRPFRGWELMVAIVPVRMIVYAAKPVIEKMCSDNKQNGWYKQPGFVVNKKQFQTQQRNASNKKERRQQGVMMFLIAMIK